MLSVTANGYGKRCVVEEYPIQRRAGKGVITLRRTKRTGPLVAISGVVRTDDIMIITESGTLIRTNVSGIATLGRNTQGVRLMRLKDGDTIAAVTRVVQEDPPDTEASA